MNQTDNLTQSPLEKASDSESLETRLQTPSQTIGPFFAYSLTPVQYGYDFTKICDGTLVTDQTPGEPITLTGRVLDGSGTPISDALVEIWQANSEGEYTSDFNGFGRYGTGTDAGNRFLFQTIKPGSVDGQAPHLNVILFMRGLLVHAYTRIYFSDEIDANATDAVLNAVPSERRQTLIAQRQEASNRYQFDIRMQPDPMTGADETVFFDL